LKKAGFVVEKIKLPAQDTQATCEAYGLMQEEEIFFCRRPALDVNKGSSPQG